MNDENKLAQTTFRNFGTALKHPTLDSRGNLALFLSRKHKHRDIIVNSLLWLFAFLKNQEKNIHTYICNDHLVMEQQKQFGAHYLFDSTLLTFQSREEEEVLLDSGGGGHYSLFLRTIFMLFEQELESINKRFHSNFPCHWHFQLSSNLWDFLSLSLFPHGFFSSLRKP